MIRGIARLQAAAALRRPILRLGQSTSVVRVQPRYALHTTRLVAAEIEKSPNRLIKEKSPYLLQHARNPVDWYPWGKEAFEKAAKENKPIFLSIGYSTCHWCHVMEHESFEDKQVVKIMNEHFVNIKVDREENPGVDRLYMTYVQLVSGRGGWPMSVFLTPKLEPFFGGTYFPPSDHQGSPGFRTLLERVAELWAAAPDKLTESAENTIAQLKAFSEAKTALSVDDIDPNAVAGNALKHFEESFDSEYGGFTGAPKFPTPVQIQFLFDYYGYMKQQKETLDKAQEALDMALFTLRKIALGGIRDHIGSGFHRYSTDKYWHVPHFEKMLYDQGQLLSAYTRAYQITGDEGFAEIAKDIITYVARDLHHHEGGFYSAEDADSLPSQDATKKKEGAFYVWKAEELEMILGSEAARIVSTYYGVQKSGNVNPAQDPHGELKGENVLAEEKSVNEVAKELGLSVQTVGSIISESKAKLLKYRKEHRPKPHCDDKILTSWNGLMISGLAHAYQAFQDPRILELAKGTAQFIHKKLYQPDSKTLLRSYRLGPSNIEGSLEDYSFLVQGLLDLYEATFDEHYVSWAWKLQEKQNELFYDGSKGGFFMTPQSDTSILVRMKDEQDGAEPSANSVSLRNLIRLGTILEQESYVTMARQTIASFGATFNQFPYAMPTLTSSFMLMGHGVKQIVLTGEPGDQELQKFKQIVSKAFVPNKIVLLAKKDGIIAEKNNIVGQLAVKAQGEPAAAHICEHFTCGLPIKDVQQLRKEIMD